MRKAQGVLDVVHRKIAVTLRKRIDGLLILRCRKRVTRPGQQPLARPNPNSRSKLLCFICPNLRDIVLHNRGRHKEDDLFALQLIVVTLEGVPENRNIAETRNLAALDFGVFLEETTEHERLSALHAHIGDNFTRVFVWHGQFRALRICEILDLGIRQARREFHANRTIRRNERPEDELDTRVEELDRLRRRRLRRRRCEVTDATTDENLRSLAIQRHDAWTCEHRCICHAVEHAKEDGNVVGNNTDTQR